MITTISPNITLRLAKSQLAPTAVPAMLLLAVSSPSLASQFPKPNLIRGRTVVGHPYFNGGISFDEQPIIEGAAHFYNNLKIVFAPRRHPDDSGFCGYRRQQRPPRRENLVGYTAVLFACNWQVHNLGAVQAHDRARDKRICPRREAPGMFQRGD